MKKMMLCLMSMLMLCSCSSGSEKHSGSVYAMDTYMTITAYGENAEEGINAVKNRLTELDRLWSVNVRDSDVYKINSSAGVPVSVSSETASLISFGKDINLLTNGAFDISVFPIVAEWGFTTGEHHIPSDETLNELLDYVGSDRIAIAGNDITLPENMKLDLGALAKGRAGDISAELLKEKGVESAVIDLGGNIRTLGSKPDGSKWKIGLRDPFSDGVFATLELGETNVVTSGAYERFFEQNGKRYHHIIDPSTGRPAESGIASATVIGKDGKLCDALSTSLYIIGKEGAEKLLGFRDDLDYIIVTDSCEVVMSEGVADRFKLAEGCDMKVSVIR